MGATEIGMGKFLPQKDVTKVTLNCIGTNEKTLINTYLSTAKWWTLRIHRA